MSTNSHRHVLHPFALSVVGASLAGLIAGCGGGSDEMTQTPSFTMTITADPPTAEAAQYIGFTVVAHGGKRLTTARIDFEGDDIWDDSLPNNDKSVEATFYHAYPDDGTYTVNAAVVDEGGETHYRSMDVDITVAELIPVSFAERAISDNGGPCLALGPLLFPMDPNGRILLPPLETAPMSMGGFTHGATVDASQTFVQYRFNSEQAYYGCKFWLTIYAGEGASRHAIGGHTCTTSSASGRYAPAEWECSIAAQGVVP